MSLLTAIGLRLYDKDSRTLAAERVREILRSHLLFAGAFISVKDTGYLGLRSDLLRELMVDNAWAVAKKYKSDAFDCDDFAAKTRADILVAGAERGFEKAVFIAEICYYRDNGVYHAANLLIDANYKLWLYEPQTGKMRDDLESEIDHAVEIWG